MPLEDAEDVSTRALPGDPNVALRIRRRYGADIVSWVVRNINRVGKFSGFVASGHELKICQWLFRPTFILRPEDPDFPLPIDRDSAFVEIPVAGSNVDGLLPGAIFLHTQPELVATRRFRKVQEVRWF